MKRKLITMLLAVTLTVSMLGGCGGGKSEEPAPAAETKTEEKAAEAPAKEEAAEAPAEEEAAEEEAAEEEAAEEEPAEEEAADNSSESDASFTLLDVDENMIDIGVYGKSPEGLELVFSMFTGPDNNKYVSLFGFDNASGGGNVICGQYEASTETDEDGDQWTYFDVKDVYSGNSFQLGVAERPETEQVLFFDENGEVIEGKYLSNAETINYMGSAAAILTDGDAGSADGGSEDSGDAEAASDVSYVDGFYANNGGEDFMIFFYESSKGDIAYVNDGSNEAFAEYTVENAKTDDGTPYLYVKVGNLGLGYIEDGDDIYLVTEDGSSFAAARLTEAEAEKLHSIVTE